MVLRSSSPILVCGLGRRVLPAPVSARSALDHGRFLTNTRSTTHLFFQIPSGTHNPRQAPARPHWARRHSHTASPCRAPTHQPANRTSVSCLQHTFLSSCGCCALQLPAARRCGVGCAVINEREPRTGAQEPLLWDLLLYYRYCAYDCFDVFGRTVQRVTGCLCDDEHRVRLRPCADVFTWTTLQSCRPIPEAAPRLEHSNQRITAIIVMFSVEGIQRMAVQRASFLQHSTDSDARAPSLTQRLSNVCSQARTTSLPGTLGSRRRNGL